MSRVLALMLAGAMLTSAVSATELRLRIDDRGQPAQGRYDLQLTAFAQAEGGVALGAPLTLADVDVADGSLQLALPPDWPGTSDAHVAVALADAGSGGFSALPDRIAIGHQAATLADACWAVSGNTGTSIATDFLGTRDNQPLALRANNLEALRITPMTISPTIKSGHIGNSVASDAHGAVVLGGGAGANSDPNTTLEGFNNAGAEYSAVIAGTNNGTLGEFSAILAGSNNFTDGAHAVVLGGTFNSALGDESATLASQGAVALGERSLVAASSGARAAGARSVALANSAGCAGGTASLAIGEQARVRGASSGVGVCTGVPASGDANGDENTVLFSGGSVLTSSGPNQFLARATGGFGFAAVDGDPPVSGGFPLTQFDVIGQRSGHAMLVRNLSTTGSNGIAVRLEVANPNTANNFLSFINGANATVGAIEGNSGGNGIQLTSGGADFAEWLPRIDAKAQLKPGEVVGLRDGRVGRDTLGADLVMVLSTGAAVAGNVPGDDPERTHSLVALVGQADVRTRGAVRAGQLLVPSGRSDGVAVAWRNDSGRLPTAVIGLALADARDGRTRTLVGAGAQQTLSVTTQLADALQSARTQLDALTQEVASLRRLVLSARDRDDDARVAVATP